MRRFLREAFFSRPEFYGLVFGLAVCGLAIWRFG